MCIRDRATTELLAAKQEGEFIADFVGPLGVPTHTEGLKKVAVVGGGVGCAIAYPVAKKLHELGCEVHSLSLIHIFFRGCRLEGVILKWQDPKGLAFAKRASP